MPDTQSTPDIIHDVREGVLLGEQQFGLFEGVDWKELERFYPNEVAFYRKSSSFGGRFWARMPLGESRFDVCQRVHQSFGAFHRDAERHGITDLIIVSHGVTLRAFQVRAYTRNSGANVARTHTEGQMMWQDRTPEWFEHEPNPRNCSVRVLSGNNTDEGYVWGGPEVPEHDSQNLLLRAVSS